MRPEQARPIQQRFQLRTLSPCGWVPGAVAPCSRVCVTCLSGLAASLFCLSARPPARLPQVIIERMDRLKPGIHLTLKVASVMGQWVDLDILHKFYPINKSKEELRAHLQELERGECCAGL